MGEQRLGVSHSDLSEDRLSGMDLRGTEWKPAGFHFARDAMRQLNGFKPCNESKVRDDELRSPRKGPFSPSSGEKVAEGRMRGFSLTCHLETIPLTLALSPRTVVNLLRNSFAGERGQIAAHINASVHPEGRIFIGSGRMSQSLPKVTQPANEMHPVSAGTAEFGCAEQCCKQEPAELVVR